MPVERSRQDHVELVVINRPEAANSIDLETGEQLAAAFDELQGDRDVRAVVLTGAGERAFCAGMDLKAVQAGLADRINGVSGGFGGLVRRADFPHPVVAAVNGTAVGGGFELVLACDVVVAAEEALFGLPEVRQGLMAASGGLVRLAKRIPPPVALELALTGEAIDAARAYELGLVNRVVPRSEVLEEAMALAAKVAGNAPVAVRASKRLLGFALEGDDAAIWELNGELSSEVLGSADATEGALAFAEKRVPHWKGE
jgi:enoyl-CoA hydratase